jgi:hypothetical protein
LKLLSSRLSNEDFKKLFDDKVISNDRFAKKRAEEAYFAGNDIGKAGAVNYLNSKEQDILQKWILSQKLCHKYATYHDVLIKVYLFSPLESDFCSIQAQSIKNQRVCGVDYSQEPPPKSGRAWVRCFVKAHPALMCVKGRILELARQRAWNREIIEPFYKKFFFFFVLFPAFVFQTLGSY